MLLLEGMLAPSRRSWGYLGPSCLQVGGLGAILAPTSGILGVILAPSWGSGGHLGGHGEVLARSWICLWRSWGVLGPLRGGWLAPWSQPARPLVAQDVRRTSAVLRDHSGSPPSDSSLTISLSFPEVSASLLPLVAQDARRTSAMLRDHSGSPPLRRPP